MFFGIVFEGNSCLRRRKKRGASLYEISVSRNRREFQVRQNSRKYKYGRRSMSVGRETRFARQKHVSRDKRKVHAAKSPAEAGLDESVWSSWIDQITSRALQSGA